MSDDYFEDQDPTAGDGSFSLSRTASVLRRYAWIIGISIAVVIAAYVIGASIYYLLQPRQQITSLPFRLEFKGAERGEYPNNLRFSVADITATPVLLDVFNTSDLGRFVRFDQFSRSLFVLEANRELDRLTAEYQTKLADSRLTPVDRERIERDFEAKRASISKSGYSLQFAPAGAVRDIPHALVPKILDDTLRTWARRAAIEKRALDYRVPVLSTNVLSDIHVDTGEYLVPLLLLRRRVDDVLQNLERLRAIPGIELIRTAKERVSIEEVRLMLDELIRFRLEPLIATARSSGLLGSGADALSILLAQLSYDERALAAARGREAALRNALITYESAQGSLAVPDDAVTASPGDNGRRETVMPQISDTFLDRIVDLANRNADREYRQSLTEEIKNASLAIVPLEAAVKYDQELIAAFRTSAGGGGVNAETLSKRWADLLDAVRMAVMQLNEIYRAASGQLYPETELYRVLGPPLAQEHRAVSATRLILGGLLTILIAFPIILAGVFVHDRIREEDDATRDAASSHTGE